MFYENRYVITANVRVVWDGITKPETKPDGTTKYSLKVAMLASAPEFGELDYIIKTELQEGIFKGQLPPDGRLPIHDIKPGEYDNLLQGHKAFNTSSQFVPEVFDINGVQLDPMQYGSMLYPGATVQLIVHAWSYNNKGNKGIALGVDGIKIIDATTPKLPVGAGINAAAAFGAAPAPQMAPQQAPAPQMAPQQAPAPQMAPQQAPAPQMAPQQAPAPQMAPQQAPAPQMAPQQAPAPAPEFLTYQGQQYTADQLRGFGWTDQQIDSIR